jgi:hypothetical protein
VHPEAPGNCQVIEELGYFAGYGGKAIISVAVIPEARSRWEDVVAVYVPCESPDANVVRQACATARIAIQTAGLPLRPILSYTREYVWRDSGADWVGIQCYFTAPQTADQFSAYWQRALSALPATQKVVLIGQAYDRNGTWKDEAAIAQLQGYFADALRDPRCVGLLWFAYGRPGGVLQYPSWLAWHKAIVAAIPGTPAVENLTVPPPPPGSPPSLAPSVLIDGWTPVLRRGQPWDVTFHEPNSPTHLRGRVWLKPLPDGTFSVHVRLEDDRGGDQTGKTRVVRVEGP